MDDGEVREVIGCEAISDPKLAPQKLPTAPVRSLEKSRTSTCEFADRVAQAVLAVFWDLPIEDEKAAAGLRGAGAQMCVSGIVVHDRATGDLRVCSVGAGTKVLPEEISKSGGDGLERVLDCHAEVLARRGFISFLYGELTSLITKPESFIFIRGPDGLARVRTGLTFHLYASSAPCGNACVRRWAKGQLDKFDDSFGKDSWPNRSHTKINVLPPLQTAVLCKVAYNSGVARKNEDEIPPGTSLPGSVDASARATCSDKICRWVGLGLEGSLLSGLITSHPVRGVRLDSIVVGRKFSRLHLERAMCCRLQGFITQEEHPASLCTAVKLHEGGRTADGKAQFADYALVWSSGGLSGRLDIIIPSVGLTLDGSPSFVCKAALARNYCQLVVAEGDIKDYKSYQAFKRLRAREGYMDRRDDLLTSRLKNWPQGLYNPDQLRVFANGSDEVLA